MKSTKQIVTTLEKERKKLAACRDNLRELLDEVETQLESCQEACDNLQSAIDILSEYV